MATILVIEDEEIVRRVLHAILCHAGHTVLQAVDGREGIKVYDNYGQIDLIITDLLMPDQEGLETIQLLRKRSSTVKIAAMSGGGLYYRFDFLHVAKHLGADMSLKKPFTRTEVLEMVDEMLES